MRVLKPLNTAADCWVVFLTVYLLPIKFNYAAKISIKYIEIEKYPTISKIAT